MPLREDALYASYRRLERPLYNVLYRQLWQVQDAQDIIQDAYMRLWERRSRVEEASLDALVWTTALNLAKNRLRWRRLWRQVPLDESLSEPADGPGQEDFLAMRQLRQALAALPPAWREVLLLAEFSGMRGAQIAVVLGIPEGTVASRKHHALARLRQLLGGHAHA